MIIADRKPIQEILDMIGDCEKLLIVGCNACVAVCMAGGEKEVSELASLIKIAKKKQGKTIEITEQVTERQCEEEFIKEIEKEIKGHDIILSMACGVGVQLIAKMYEGKLVYPALNTKFMGLPEEQGQWAETCAGCGDCRLADFGGICPVTRCSKSLLNGPCGGSVDGKCEVDPDNIECAWQLIYDKMKLLGQLDKLLKIEPAKSWKTSRDGGPRKVIKEEVRL